MFSSGRCIMSEIDPERIARPGTLWICAACGKKHTDRYGQGGRGSYGWDESCMMNAVLCYEERKPGDDGVFRYEAVNLGKPSRAP